MFIRKLSFRSQSFFSTSWLSILFILSFLLLTGCNSGAAATEPVPSSPAVQKALTELPGGDVWLHHVKYDLLPFWTQPSALGKPVGNFPTYRYNDGSLVNPRTPLPPFSTMETNKDYVRMKSRQIYAYGVAFHLTGDEKLLAYAKAGVDYLRNNAFFTAANGTKGVYTYFREDSKTWGPSVNEINSQDLSYALNGLSFYYYLTRDSDVLDDIIAVKEYIFQNYYDPNTNLLSWFPRQSKEAHAKELVATLDQINAYMLNLAPALPVEYKGRKLQQEWRDELKRMAFALIKEYYSPENNLFWGTATHALGTRHVDYGHSGKTFWMILQIGKLTGNQELITFVNQHAPALLERAYIPKTGSWASRPGDDGKEWWIYAELDQLAATLSLENPAFANYLVKTNTFWLTHMVDASGKEVWPGVGPNGEFSPDAPKQFHWKNGFHSLEHALIGYITSQQLKNQDVSLHFAFTQQPDESSLRPYLFSGTLAGNETVDNNHSRITFRSIK